MSDDREITAMIAAGDGTKLILTMLGFILGLAVIAGVLIWLT